MSAWPPQPPPSYGGGQGPYGVPPPFTTPSTAPPPPGGPAGPSGPSGSNPSSRFAAGIAVGIIAGLIAGLVGGFVAGRAGRDDGTPATSSGGVTQSTFTIGSPTDTTLVPPSPDTTRSSPASVGTKVDVGNGWRVQVKGFDDAPDTSSEPPPGKQWVTVDIAVTYVKGDKESQSPFFGLDLSLVGDNGEEYGQGDAACVAPEPRFDNLGDLYVGGSTSGNLCLAVAPADLSSLVLVAEPSLNMNRAPKSYLAVR